MADEHHYVFVTFNTTREQQAQALREIGDYVAGFLSQQPGFVQSRLLASQDGEQVFHQAQWENEAAFQAAGQLARQHPDLPKLMLWTPVGVGCTLYRQFPR
jgi:heme-degrading monooxygenase HmoA